MDLLSDESWLCLTLVAAWIWITARLAGPPGSSYTSAWIFTGVLGILLGSKSVLELFFVMGSGLMVSWYGVQVVYGDTWPKIMTIWIPLFHKYNLTTGTVATLIVRFGDIYLHVVPFMTLMMGKTGGASSWRPVLQAMLFDRLYFLAIDGLIVGDGRQVNRVYRIYPAAPPRFFWALQTLSLVGHLLSLVDVTPHLYQALIVAALVRSHFPLFSKAPKAAQATAKKVA